MVPLSRSLLLVHLYREDTFWLVFTYCLKSTISLHSVLTTPQRWEVLFHVSRTYSKSIRLDSLNFFFLQPGWHPDQDFLFIVVRLVSPCYFSTSLWRRYRVRTSLTTFDFHPSLRFFLGDRDVRDKTRINCHRIFVDRCKSGLSSTPYGSMLMTNKRKQEMCHTRWLSF